LSSNVLYRFFSQPEKATQKATFQNHLMHHPSKIKGQEHLNKSQPLLHVSHIPTSFPPKN